MKTKAPFCLVAVVVDSRRVVEAVGMKQLIHKPATLSPTSNTLLYLLNLLFFCYVVFLVCELVLVFLSPLHLVLFLFFWLKSGSPHSLYPLFRLIPSHRRRKNATLLWYTTQAHHAPHHHHTNQHTLTHLQTTLSRHVGLSTGIAYRPLQRYLSGLFFLAFFLSPSHAAADLTWRATAEL